MVTTQADTVEVEAQSAEKIDGQWKECRNRPITSLKLVREVKFLILSTLFTIHATAVAAAQNNIAGYEVGLWGAASHGIEGASLAKALIISLG